MFRDKDIFFQIDDFEKYEVLAIYTTKKIGNTFDLFKNIGDNEKNSKNIEKFFGKKNSKVILAQQTHSANVIDITENTDKYYFENTDGFITKRKDIVLMTQYADCLPVYVYDKKNNVIGIFHSGWKGSFEEIAIVGINLMIKNYGSKKEDFIIALGIGISCEKYEVGEEFYTNFKNKFPLDIVKKSFVFCETTKKYHFDNTEFNRLNLISYGIPEESIIISKECTYKNNRFHSFRRDKNEKRNAGIIFFKD